MQTAERNFGIHTADAAAPALANRCAAGNSALVVGTYGADHYRSLLAVQGISVFTLPKRPRRLEVVEAAGALKLCREGLGPPCAVFVPMWKNVPKSVRGVLLRSADIVAVLLPVGDPDNAPPVFDADDMAAMYRYWIMMHYDEDESEAGWAAALSFEPEKVWTPDGAMWV